VKLSDKLNISVGLLGVLVSITLAIISGFAGDGEKADAKQDQLSLDYYAREVFSPVRGADEGLEGVNISLFYRGREIENGSIFDLEIENNGTAPIRPDDIYEPIRVEGVRGIEIVDVEPRGGVETEWSRDNKGGFVAQKKLLNEGDEIKARVFLKSTKSIDPEESGRSLSLLRSPVIVEARIAGLKKIQKRSFVRKREKISAHWRYVPFTISLYSWAIPFCVISFVAYLSVYLLSAQRLGWLASDDSRSIIFVLSVAALSLWGAEAGASLLQRSFPDLGPWFSRGALSMNLPPVLINATGIAYVLWRVWKADNQPKDDRSSA